uniref:Uncharacterized protein n=1 Tax=Oryza glumipatula TaxID=40148 RepID=A0A0E0ARF3_9ORYZ
MAAMLARLAGKQQQLLLQYALRRSPAPPGRRLPGVVPALPLLWSAPFLGGSRRLKSYNAAAGVAVGGDKAAADHHHRHAVGADLDVGELASEEHYSAAGTSSSSSRDKRWRRLMATSTAARRWQQGRRREVAAPKQVYYWRAESRSKEVITCL